MMNGPTVRIGGRDFESRPGLTPRGLMKDGIDGWYSGPSSRASSDDIPGQHGGTVPEEVLASSQVYVVRGFERAASFDAARRDIITWVSALSMRKDLTLVVEDGMGALSAKVWVRGNVKTAWHDSRTVKFELTLFAPDPRKYGVEQLVRLDSNNVAPGGLTWPLDADGRFKFVPFSTLGGFGGNTITLRNPGSAESWVIFEADGQIPAGLSITSEGDELRFERDIDASGNPAKPALIMSPYAGGRAVMNGVDMTTDLVAADWMSIQPEESRTFTFAGLDEPLAGAYVQGRVRGAWW